MRNFIQINWTLIEKKKQLNVFADLWFVRYNRTGYKQDQVNIIIKLWSWEGQQVSPYEPTTCRNLTGTSRCQFSKFWELTVNLQPCFCHWHSIMTEIYLATAASHEWRAICHPATNLGYLRLMIESADSQGTLLKGVYFGEEGWR